MALTTRTLPALMNGISLQPAILRSPDQTEDELNTWGDIARGVGRRPPTQSIKALFPNLVINGDFTSNVTSWAPTNAALSAVGGRLRVSTTSANTPGKAVQRITVTAGKTYRLKVDAFGGSIAARVLVGTTDFGQEYGTLTGSGELVFTPTEGFVYIQLYAYSFGSPAGSYSEFDNVRMVEDFDLGDATVHHINRDVTERYTVIIDQGVIQVFDETTGEQRTVTAPLGWGYLDAAGPNYRAVTIADYTFIVNTQKTVSLKGVGADEATQDPNLRFPGGNNPTRINGGFYSSLRAGTTAQYEPNPPAPAGGLTGTVPDMTKLPDPPTAGAVYKVLGQNETSFVSYYVRGDGAVWDETVAPGLLNAIDESTMPHVLIREADGTFTFSAFSWKPRRVGDQDTNPVPPFIDRTIRDVFFYQNRLGFLSDESVIFSVAGDYGDFWRRTVLDYIDSDALAASATTTDVAIMEWAVPFADGVMLFSAQRQLSLTNGDSGLSAHSLSIQPVTSYLMSPNVKPTPMGSQVHFVTDSSGQAAVQEYTRLAGADPTEAADITAHVPGLLPKGATQLIPAHDLNALFVLTRDADPDSQNRMYAYQFFWDGDKKLQSAWRVWDFGDGKPVSGAYESGTLHLLMERPDGFFIEKIDLSPSAVSDNQTHRIYLDRQEALTGVYDPVANTTTFTASFAIDPDVVRIVRGVGSSSPEGTVSPAGYVVSGTTITVPGDESAAAATVGHLFTTKLVPSQQYAQDWQGHLLTSGRLVIHTFTVNMTNTAYTRAEVYPYGLDANTLNPGLFNVETFTGKHVGLLDDVIGQQGYFTGPFMFSVAGNSQNARIELINDSPFGSTWTSAEWEGLFFSRAL